MVHLPSSESAGEEDVSGEGCASAAEDPVEDCETGSELLDAGELSGALELGDSGCFESLDFASAELDATSLDVALFPCTDELSAFVALLELDSTAGVSAAEDAGDSVPEGESSPQAANKVERQRRRAAFFIMANRSLAYLVILM